MEQTQPEVPMMVVCDNCGYEGPMEEFLKEDPNDSRCPECGESVELTYEL